MPGCSCKLLPVRTWSPWRRTNEKGKAMSITASGANIILDLYHGFENPWYGIEAAAWRNDSSQFIQAAVNISALMQILTLVTADEKIIVRASTGKFPDFWARGKTVFWNFSFVPLWEQPGASSPPVRTMEQRARIEDTGRKCICGRLRYCLLVFYGSVRTVPVDKVLMFTTPV